MKKKMKGNAPSNSTLKQEAACMKDIENVYQVQNRKAEAYDRRALDRVQDPRSDWFGGLDPRRRQENADSGMIRPDMTAIANCPKQAIHHEWPIISYYQNPYIDDTVD